MGKKSKQPQEEQQQRDPSYRMDRQEIPVCLQKLSNPISLLYYSSLTRTSNFSFPEEIVVQRINSPLSFISSCLQVYLKVPASLTYSSLHQILWKIECVPCNVFVPTSTKCGPQESATLRWLGSNAQILTGVSLVCQGASRRFPSYSFSFLCTLQPHLTEAPPIHLKNTGKGSWESLNR